MTTNRPASFALQMPALNGDVVTQAHADYCAENGHARHSVDGVVSPVCPRCGGSIAPTAEQVFEITSEAPGQVPMSERVAAALPYLHNELVGDSAVKFNVHLRAAGEGLAAFWHDERDNSWRIEFPDEDRNLIELVVFAWKDDVDFEGKPLVDEDGEPTGAGRWHSAHTSTVQARRVIENLGL